MTDKATPTKKEPVSNEKISNNQSTSTLNQENTVQTSPPLNSLDNTQNKIGQNFTFKIIKRRAPWNKKEDDAIIDLVNKYGTSNWTIIANEMANLYKSKHRNGKQCRERWHNHLDPIVNKNNWTEEEENILFNKHLEFGNKWSEISKCLPGRTDNSIKNHFYSKLRKYIRKILKQINKENLLKSNGIDYYKYNSDKVYKLLKKYKVSYKNVNKDTILDIIISTEKNQKGKIFGISEEKKSDIVNNDDKNNNFKVNTFSAFNINNNLDKSVRNNSSNKIISKKQKLKTIQKSNSEEKNRKIFQSKIVNEFKSGNNLGDNITQNQLIGQVIPQIIPKNLGKKIKKTDNELNKENDINKMNNIISTKKAENNQELHKEKNKLKKIKKKKNENEPKMLNKKRKKKKKKKVNISLSTPEKKKTQISRIMPGRKFHFSFGQRLNLENQAKRMRRKKLCQEDFDPNINDVEILRDGLEVHSKSIIIINKNLLTENFFPDKNYAYKPNLNIAIPQSPRIQQFPSCIPKSTKNLYASNYQNFNEKNISIGPPTPMDGFYEPQISPMGNMMIYPGQMQPNNNHYNNEFGLENQIFMGNPYTPIGFPSSNIINTPKKEINLQDKIVIQNNNNMNDVEVKMPKKKPTLNMEFIDNYNNNENNISPTFPFFTNPNGGSSIPRQIIPTPMNMFNLSPSSPFIPRNIPKK